MYQCKGKSERHWESFPVSASGLLALSKILTLLTSMGILPKVRISPSDHCCFQQHSVSPSPGEVSGYWHQGTGYKAHGHQAVPLSWYGTAAVLWFQRGKPRLGRGGQTGSYTMAMLQERITTGGSRAWGLDTLKKRPEPNWLQPPFKSM